MNYEGIKKPFWTYQEDPIKSFTIQWNHAQALSKDNLGVVIFHDIERDLIG